MLCRSSNCWLAGASAGAAPRPQLHSSCASRRIPGRTSHQPAPATRLTAAGAKEARSPDRAARRRGCPAARTSSPSPAGAGDSRSPHLRSTGCWYPEEGSLAVPLGCARAGACVQSLVRRRAQQVALARSAATPWQSPRGSACPAPTPGLQKQRSVRPSQASHSRCVVPTLLERLLQVGSTSTLATCR